MKPLISTTTLKPQISQRRKLPKILKMFFGIFGAFFIIVASLSVFLYFTAFFPGKDLLAKINIAKSTATNLQQIATSKDLVKIDQQLDILEQDRKNIEIAYSKLSLWKSFPYIKDYYQDGLQFLNIGKESINTGKLLIKAIEPYQDFLGLKGNATDSSKTTQDRIAFLTQSVEGLLPHLSALETNINNIQNSLSQIDPSRYPEEYNGQKIRPSLLKAKEVVAEVHKLVKDGRPILEKTPWLLGKDSPRQYFLLFQNDAELRPSGGFWTAYGILKVDKGKITPVISDDIYALDAKFQSTIPAPRPIKSYHINVPYWNLRDLNISPDFATDVELFLQHYKKISPKDKFDAVIAIDTQVLVDFVKVLGRVGVPGWGNFSSDPDKRCDGCPQIIYQLEYIAGKPRSYIETDRKGFLAPLMHSLLANAMGSPKEKIEPLVQGILNNVYQKHILFYFIDPEIQKAANLANISGKIVTIDQNTDYLHLNDANMASAKSNLFIRQKIKHEIISQNGQIEHKVTVTYTNPSKASNCNLEKGDLCLNAPKYRDWFRFYVPTGSKLIKMTGSEVDPVQYEELGKQVFEGFYGDKFPLYAQSSSKVSIQYATSVKPSSNYTLLLQKQPGTKPIEYELWVNGQQHDQFSWTSDKTIKLAL